MKFSILFSMLFLVLNLQGQSFKDLVIKYEQECNQLVELEVEQTGNINYNLIPIIKDEKLIKYGVAVKDTVWNKVECPEYKIEPYHTGFAIKNYFKDRNDYFGNSLILDSIETVEYTTDTIVQKEIKRKHKCMVKLKQAQPFSDDFWNWIKKQ